MLSKMHIVMMTGLCCVMSLAGCRNRADGATVKSATLAGNVQFYNIKGHNLAPVTEFGDSYDSRHDDKKISDDPTGTLTVATTDQWGKICVKVDPSSNFQNVCDSFKALVDAKSDELGSSGAESSVNYIGCGMSAPMVFVVYNVGQRANMTLVTKIISQCGGGN